MLRKKTIKASNVSNWKKFSGYFWNNLFPQLLAVFAAFLIFEAQGIHDAFKERARKTQYLTTYNAELENDIFMVNDTLTRLPILKKEASKEGQRYFTFTLLNEMQKLACGPLTEYFTDL